MSSVEHWTLCLCLPPLHTAVHALCYILQSISNVYTLSGVQGSSTEPVEDLLHEEAIWKSNMTLWQEEEEVPKWREHNGNHSKNKQAGLHPEEVYECSMTWAMGLRKSKVS